MKKNKGTHEWKFLAVYIFKGSQYSLKNIKGISVSFLYSRKGIFSQNECGFMTFYCGTKPFICSCTANQQKYKE